MPKKSVWRIQSDKFISTCFESCRPVVALDIGCGESKWKCEDYQIKVVGVDNTIYSGVDFVCDVVQGLPFKDGEFQLVLMNNFLEHTIQPRKVLQHVNRVLDENGTLVITVPFLVKIHQAPIDYFRYTPFALTKLLNESGFKVDTLESLTGIGHTLMVHISTSFTIATANTDQLWKRYLLNLIKRNLNRFLKTLLYLFEALNQTSDKYTLGYGIRCSKRGSLK